MATHRYWRLNVTNTVGGSYLAIAELVLAESFLGAQAATGGTASSSSDYGGYPASNCFDGNLSSFSHSASGMPQTISYDLGAGNEKDFAQLRITQRSGQASTAPSTFALQWSDDDSAWTDHITASGIVWADTQTEKMWQAAGVPTYAELAQVVVEVLSFIPPPQAQLAQIALEVLRPNVAEGSSGGPPRPVVFFAT